MYNFNITYEFDFWNGAIIDVRTTVLYFILVNIDRRGQTLFIDLVAFPMIVKLHSTVSLFGRITLHQPATLEESRSLRPKGRSPLLPPML